MEDPKTDISSVILNLTTTESPDTQQETVLKYMTADVSFEHPVCSVRPGPNSRDKVLKIYQWYRVLISQSVFDRERQVMYVEIVQMFKLFFLPVESSACEVRPHAVLVTRLELRKIKSLYYISRQEDFYHTIDFARLVLPPIVPLVWFLLTFGAIFSIVATKTVPGDREELYEMDNISLPVQTRA
ncbi:hypothetical protein DFP72DRAFT_893247 [Ephemerocybe angulata]|uniref:SigF-like NTF2-like domain-containing protein n=1 Tax=Ephemerocybe angulata TaxID=980116 RepID=A0A8H6M895_9AGAR|nr:hypothetical protein DFP72DRAFT_893247 [Tulosesus angulatus]